MLRRSTLLTLAATVVLGVGACSSDDSDDPSGTVAPAGSASTTTVSPILDEPPPTGLVSIDGPATVDPSFTGADSGGG